jgi:hypothetical protein
MNEMVAQDCLNTPGYLPVTSSPSFWQDNKFNSEEKKRKQKLVTFNT